MCTQNFQIAFTGCWVVTFRVYAELASILRINHTYQYVIVYLFPRDISFPQFAYFFSPTRRYVVIFLAVVAICWCTCVLFGLASVSSSHGFVVVVVVIGTCVNVYFFLVLFRYCRYSTTTSSIAGWFFNSYWNGIQYSC